MMKQEKGRISAKAELVEQVQNWNSKATSYRQVVNELRELKVLISELAKLTKSVSGQKEMA